VQHHVLRHSSLCFGDRHGGTYRCLQNLLRWKLVHHDGSAYDGFRLTYLGYDYLAIKALLSRGSIASVGRQIGVGKESDVFEVLLWGAAAETNRTQFVLSDMPNRRLGPYLASINRIITPRWQPKYAMSLLKRAPA
jgi:Rio2, N-terminal